MPVGMLPATMRHCGRPPVQPVVVKLWTDASPAWKLAGAPGSITQLPDGGGVVAGGGVADGGQPDSLTVAVGVWPSETTTLQSGAVKPDAATLKWPDVSDRLPAALVVDSTVTKMPGRPWCPRERAGRS